MGRRRIILDGRRRVSVKRRRNRRGDLPDWVASNASLTTLVVAEAKGCHDTGGPSATLQRAWAQADRVNVLTRGGRRAGVKRIAIATRWGMTSGGPHDPIMAVKDPDEIGDMTSDEMDAAFVGVARQHAASLLKGTGQEELSNSLQELIRARSLRARREAQRDAAAILDAAKVEPPLRSQSDAHVEQLVGGWLTRAGHIREARLSPNDVEVLRRLDLRPVFVGLEPQFLRSAIEGDLERVRSRVRERITSGPVRTNGSGIWMLRPPEAEVG